MFAWARCCVSGGFHVRLGFGCQGFTAAICQHAEALSNYGVSDSVHRGFFAPPVSAVSQRAEATGKHSISSLMRFQMHQLFVLVSGGGGGGGRL